MRYRQLSSVRRAIEHRHFGGYVSEIEQLLEELGQNLVYIAVWGTITILLVAIVWITIPRILHKFLASLDRVVPGEFVLLDEKISRVTVLIIVLTILAGAAEYIISGTRNDPSITFDIVAAGGRWIGEWLLANGFKVLLVVLAGLIAERFAIFTIPRLVEAQIRSRPDAAQNGEMQKNIETLSGVLTRAATLTITVGTVFLVMDQIGVDLAPLLVAAGAVAIGVGFAVQNLIRDVLSGSFIILENQYRIGDVVNIAGIGGLVEDINLRRTVLRDLDYKQHYIPNGQITTTTNYTKDKSRVNINIGVAYKTDLQHAFDVLNRVGQELADDEEWGPIILDPIQVLRVDAFGESAIEIKVLGEVLPIRQWDVAGQYRMRVKSAFDAEDIEIPFPHLTLYMGDAAPETLALRGVMMEAQRATPQAQDAGSRDPGNQAPPEPRT